MTKDRTLKDLVNYWLERVAESLDSARSELDAGRLAFAVNRLYYALFYLVTAALAVKGEKHGKHSAVRSSFHREYVRTGKVDKIFGKLYDELFHARHQGDYMPMVGFDETVIRQQLQNVEKFISEFSGEIKQMLERG
jgi:uncharacterized protein (UPF0332 family)